MSNVTKKTDPRVKRTKQMFKDALVSLIREGDKSKITVQSVAERAELNRATFYLHYRDLEDLTERMMDDILAELFESIAGAPDITRMPVELDEPPPQLLSLLEHLYRNAVLYNVMLENNVVFRKRMHAVFLNIATIRDKYRQAEGLELTVSMEIVASSLLGVVTWWLQEGLPYSPAYLAKQMMLMGKTRK
ncbi:TetR/AcrR family transcriptional regulator [Cohnella suwonensis]|uniref:TetR/AcrR family transcriptional regulator n=1 Tax=Cohnella suwonensis TaxID=696072 RepID=A0ABW0LP38_9BACL